MELNTKYLTTSELDMSEGHIVFKDYRGQSLVTLMDKPPVNGDIVVVLFADGQDIKRTLVSNFDVDALVKRQLITKLNQVFAKAGKHTRVRDYDVWYRDAKGRECLGSRCIH